MPAAIATLPSNGAVASTSHSTLCPASAGDAFLQLLRTADAAEAAAGGQAAAGQAAGRQTATGKTAGGQAAGGQVAAGQAATGQAADDPAEPAPAQAAGEADAARSPANRAKGEAAGATKTGRTAAKAAVPGDIAAAAPTAGVIDPAAAVMTMRPPACAETAPNESPLGRAAGGTVTASGGGVGMRPEDPPAPDDSGPSDPRIGAADAARLAAATATPQADIRPLRAIPQTAGQPTALAGAPPSTVPAVAPSGLLAEPASAASAATAPAAPASAPPAAARNDSVTPPAAQIGSALLSLGPAADGSQQMTLRLHPVDLGVVQVQIGRTETGAARVEITAEKADTLQALLRDQPQLHRALDDAGVAAAGRIVTFHTAPVPPEPAGAGGFASAQNQGGGGSANGNSLDGSGPNGSGKSGYGAPEGDPTGRRPSRPPAAKTEPAGTTWYRAGIDIVA